MPELTTKQIRFLSKYLHVVPKSGRTKRSKTKNRETLIYNDLVKLNFADYNKKKAEADDLAARVKQMANDLNTMSSGIKEGKGGEAVGVFRTQLSEVTGHIDRLTREISKIHTTTIDAPEGKPIFGVSKIELARIMVNLYAAKARLPKPPPIINDGVLGLLYSTRAEIASLRIFADNTFLNDKIVLIALPKKESDTIREDAYEAHRALCRDVDNNIASLISLVLKKESALTADAATSRTTRLLDVLVAKRQGPIKTLIEVIKAAAKSKIDTLAGDGNDVALRENKRSAEIAKKVEKLKEQYKALGETVKDLFDAQAKATGFKEKQGIAKQYEDAAARLAAMKDYINQLGAYDDGLALRVQRISAAVEGDEKGLSLAADPEDYINASGVNLEPFMSKNADLLLLGGLEKKNSKNDPDKHVNGRYGNLLAKFTLASKRVTVDVKLFLGEDELTDISQPQLATLLKILNKGKDFADAGVELNKAGEPAEAGEKFARAQFLFDEAEKLYAVFNASNKFPLPPAPAIPERDTVRLEKAFKSGMVELDRFWGIGGDENDTLRKQLGAAETAFAKTRKTRQPRDFSAIDTLIQKFQTALATAQKSFAPSPTDQQAKEAAANARNEIVDGLLNLYRTKPLQEAEISDVPVNRLLVVEKGGKTQYFEILTKKKAGKDISRRDDKHIPPESIDLLLEQATMLELLAKSNAPDCADAIAQAIQESKKKLDGIMNGGDDFDYIAAKIKDCDKLFENKSLNSWIPADLFTVKTNFETFTGEYTTKYLPAAGKIKADEFFATITKLIDDSNDIRVSYTVADAIMVQVEKDFFNNKGAVKSNLSTRMAEIIKAGPSAFKNVYTPTPEEEKEVAGLLAKLQSSLAEINKFKDKTGMEGPMKGRVKSARTTLDTKSADGIAKGKAEAIAIRNEMAAELRQLDPKNGMEFLKTLENFLKTQATALTENKAALEEMAVKTTAVSDALHKADEILKTKNKATFKSYKEYKTIYSSLRAQYDTTKATYKKEKDPKVAAAEYGNILPNAARLAEDLQKLTVVWVSEQPIVNFASLQQALNTKIASVRKAAIEASQKAITEAADDEEEVISRTATAAATLALAGASTITDMVTLKGTLQRDANAAIKTQDEKTRRKLLATVRETALAEVRRIRNETENHPAIKVYRDNPFVKDVSWPAFAAALHELDVQVLRTLQPR